MNLKKGILAGTAVMMAVSMTACGTSSKPQTSGSEKTDMGYTDIKLGETGKDIKTSIKVLTNRTDMLNEDYAGTNWESYLKSFNEMYPDIEVEMEGITNYAEDALLRLQGGSWGEVMMIPEQVDKADLPNYFLPYGEKSEVEKEANYVAKWLYDDQVYGITSTAGSLGIVYNKAVFSEAGITELPKTPEEFIKALQDIKEKTDAIPLYTNYAAGWTLGSWDYYIGGTATGDAKYMNQDFLHTENPFSDPGDGTHAYNVYKILYDAVAGGLTEDDYSTTDWEGSKGMINSGKIGCLALGSWAYPQMQQAGKNPEDIGYMPFPISIDGKQYTTAAPDFYYGINADTEADKQGAAMIFVKWMTEKSGFSYNEGGLPIKAGDDNYPEVYQSLLDADVEFVEDQPALKGEEDLLNVLNADTELMISAGGQAKIQELVEHAANKDMDFDSIMELWNEKWTEAQETEAIM